MWSKAEQREKQAGFGDGSDSAESQWVVDKDNEGVVVAAGSVSEKPGMGKGV